MTTETTAQDEAKKLWDQFDAEDNGAAVAAEKVEPADADAAGAAQAAPASQEQQATSEEEDDPKALRNKLAGLEAIVTQLTGRLRNAEGHIGGLNSQVKQQLDTAKAVAAAGAQAPSATEIRAAQASPEAMARLESEYPEFAKALAPALDATLNSRFAEFEKRLPKQDAPTGVTKAELEQFKAEQKIEVRHPGWQDTVKGADFIGWMGSVSREVSLLAASDEPADAIRLMDLYTESKAKRPDPLTEQRTQRLSSAAALPTGQRTAARTKNVDDMTPAEFWAYQDQLDRQQKA